MGEKNQHTTYYICSFFFPLLSLLLQVILVLISHFLYFSDMHYQVREMTFIGIHNFSADGYIPETYVQNTLVWKQSQMVTRWFRHSGVKTEDNKKGTGRENWKIYRKKKLCWYPWKARNANCNSQIKKSKIYPACFFHGIIYQCSTFLSTHSVLQIIAMSTNKINSRGEKSTKNNTELLFLNDLMLHGPWLSFSLLTSGYIVRSALLHG